MANTKIEMEFDLDRYLRDLSNFLARKLNDKAFKETVQEMFIKELGRVHSRSKIGNPDWPSYIAYPLYDYAARKKPAKDHDSTHNTKVKIILGIPDPEDEAYNDYDEGVRYYGLVYEIGIGSNGALHHELKYHRVGETGWDRWFLNQREVTAEHPKAGQPMPEGMNQKSPGFMRNLEVRLETLFQYIATEIWLPAFYEDPKHQLTNYIQPVKKG